MKTKFIKYLIVILLLAFVLSITCISAFAYHDSVLGIWVLNEELIAPSESFSAFMTFTYQGVTYDKFGITSPNNAPGQKLYFSIGDSTDNIYWFESQYGMTIGYTNSGERILEIITEPQGSSAYVELFKSWLTTNAVRESAETGDTNIYTTIYEIIKNAIWSADAVLTSGQTFALEQVSLLLSLLVILTPIFVTLAILVRCVRL